MNLLRFARTWWLGPATRIYRKISAAVLLTVVVAACAAVLYPVGEKLDIRLAFDGWDLFVYFNSASWVVEGGRLYRDVPSEYPLFANVIFAVVRAVGNLLDPRFYGFCIVWMASGWLLYLGVVNAVASATTKLAVLAWLAPAPIYFALFRFDIYPAAATLASLFAIRRAAYLQGAAWLGVAIALKGYALFLLPAYCVFVIYQRGVAAAIKVGVLAVIPLILSLVATLMFAGWDGMLAPFKLQAARTLNGESTYDAINYLLGIPLFSEGANTGRLAQGLQIGCALAAAALRPRSFEQLVNALLFAALGCMSLSAFYSPQFVLWILPLVCFSDSQIILLLAVFFSWLTYLYFPVGYDLGQGQYLKPVVMIIAVVRLIMMGLAACRTFSRDMPTLKAASWD